MDNIIPLDYLNQPAVKAAKNMLGKILVRRLPSRQKTAIIITEVEAYDGPNDKASHASCGKTERNKIMFGPAGIFYIYLTYGMHWMLNIVSGPEDYPAAVLIRGGIIINDERRMITAGLINGPAKLTKFLAVDKKLNSLPADKKTGLWLEDWNIKIKPSQIIAGKRVGIDRVPPYWRDKKYNFRISHSLFS